MNSSILFTDRSANEINYEFNSNQPLDLAAATVISELNSFIARINAVDTLAFVSIKVKYYYN